MTTCRETLLVEFYLFVSLSLLTNSASLQWKLFKYPLPDAEANTQTKNINVCRKIHTHAVCIMIPARMPHCLFQPLTLFQTVYGYSLPSVLSDMRARLCFNNSKFNRGSWKSPQWLEIMVHAEQSDRKRWECGCCAVRWCVIVWLFLWGTGIVSATHLSALDSSLLGQPFSTLLSAAPLGRF